ncbi:MAG TPA: DUF302 domain-containing protein [Candidatus Acidoferrales bacterium]|nr:DUF302 domain-containing protein [Candidatus Acidoferrales bacterium]
MKKPRILLPALFTLAVVSVAAIPISGADEAPPPPRVTSLSVIRIEYTSPKSFDAVTSAIESQLGKFDTAAFNSLMKPPLDTAKAEAGIRAMEGSSGFMLFAVRDHGQLLGLKGESASARQYEVGNPLFAVEMTQADLRAGEFAPLRMYVYVAADNLTHISYDLPSSLFGRFKSPQVDAVAKGLDQKLEKLVENALKN